MDASLILSPTILIASIGLVAGFLLAIAYRYLAVQEDPRIAKVIDQLPGANCGGCGFAGCADYAKAIVTAGASSSLCSAASAEVTKAIAQLVGQVAEVRERQVALVRCGGSNAKSTRRAQYNGVSDCMSADATAGGDKACAYGCLGYGSCARVCPVRAIEVVDGIATVNPERCIACGKCVLACPRKLIALVPATQTLHVLCSSPAKGPQVRAVCQVGCLGCTLCSKLAPGAFQMQGTLAVRDYSQPCPSQAPLEKCPVKTIVER